MNAARCCDKIDFSLDYGERYLVFVVCFSRCIVGMYRIIAIKKHVGYNLYISVYMLDENSVVIDLGCCKSSVPLHIFLAIYITIINFIAIILKGLQLKSFLKM